MKGFRARCRLGALVVLFVSVGITALYGLLKPVSSGCIMTYMYPTYIPISTPANVSSDKYGLFLYHEGWKKIDFAEYLKKLSGVPILFIPGNGGSYKQKMIVNAIFVKLVVVEFDTEGLLALLHNFCCFFLRNE